MNDLIRMNVPLLGEWLKQYNGPTPQLYLVGGFVRDLLMNRPSKDVDVACRGAKSFARRMAESLGLAFVPMEKKSDEPCYRLVDRKDAGRVLDVAELRGKTIEHDLSHRDFTINAMAARVDREGAIGEIVDPLDGRGDLSRTMIRKAGPEAFRSDPVRILRAVRFAAQLDFSIESETAADMARCAPLLGSTSAERILAELMIILASSSAASHFRMMDRVSLLEAIFPEIRVMKNCEQDAYHHLDVWQHSLLVMEHCEAIVNGLTERFGEVADSVRRNLDPNGRRELLKLAGVLHDAGKPITQGFNPRKGRFTFYRHDAKGAEIVLSIARRLKMSRRDQDFLTLLVAEHRHVHDLAKPQAKPATLLRWLRSLGDDAPPAIVLSMADDMAKHGPLADDESRERYLRWAGETVRRYYRETKAVLETPPLITGADLLALGMAPGPEMGRILSLVREAQDAGEVKTKEEALKLAMTLGKERQD